jgi:predicted transcriptional regulator
MLSYCLLLTKFILFLDTAKNEDNNSHCNSFPCSELASNSKFTENATLDTNESLMECESHSVDKSQDACASATESDSSMENINFTVIYNKQKISVNFALDGTVADLKKHLQKIISVPQAMQKVMFKGLAKDDQTLRNLGITKGNDC